MKTLVATSARTLEVTQAPLPCVELGGAILKVNACGVCGTDVEKWADRDNPDTVTLGHEIVGTLVSVCPTYRGPLRPGERVVVAHHVPCGQCHYCVNDSESMCEQFKQTNIKPGGFSEYVTLSAVHLKKTCFLVPAKVPDDRAIHVEPLACVLKAIRRGGHARQPKTLVVGLGYIGLMAAQMYALRGDNLYSVDTQRERLEQSRTFNIHRTAFFPEQLPEQHFDVVFLTVVNPQTAEFALQKVRNGGVVIIFADTPHNPAWFNASTLYHREISLVPSYSPGMQDLHDAARLVFAESIRLAPLVTHRADLDNSPALFALARSREALKAVVYPHGVPERLRPVVALTENEQENDLEYAFEHQNEACVLPEDKDVTSVTMILNEAHTKPSSAS